MKHTYLIRAHNPFYGLAGVGTGLLSATNLAQALPGAIVRSEITQDPQGNEVIDLELRRETHEQALNEIFVTLQQYGYWWVDATVTEWADNAVGGMLVGSGGGGSIGLSGGSAETALVLGGIGLVVGAIVGSLIDRVKVVYEVRRTAIGFALVQVQPAPAPAPTPAIQPRYSW